MTYAGLASDGEKRGIKSPRDNNAFNAFSTLIDERYREVIDKELSDQRDYIPRLCAVRDSDRATERISSVGEAQQWGAFTGQIDYDRLT